MGLGDYNSGRTLDDGELRISPSAMSQMVQNDGGWYHSKVLKDKPFQVNDKSRMGTITHYYIEKLLSGEREPDRKEIEEYLVKENHVDMWEAFKYVEEMYKLFKDNYKDTISGKVECEKWLEYEPEEGLMLSGTADIIMGDTILDIKTTFGGKKKGVSVYRRQLLLLAQVANKNGYNIKNIGVIVLAPTITKMAKRKIKGAYQMVETTSSGFYHVDIEPIDEQLLQENKDCMKDKLRKYRTSIDPDFIALAKTKPYLKDVEWGDVLFNINPDTYLQ